MRRVKTTGWELASRPRVMKEVMAQGELYVGPEPDPTLIQAVMMSALGRIKKLVPFLCPQKIRWLVSLAVVGFQFQIIIFFYIGLPFQFKYYILVSLFVVGFDAVALA
ncbi:hypothetical protein RIF29_14294 [Crotalaria pallida]|uniref:Uncharacterized protein n=1 Tax=Crotalaria pallida TaxID=3830 RepID=A0AAN9FD58_CROPI